MSEVISVIVAVYNVENYLSQCVDSILSQDHQALEVILVDDGSRDSSGAICDAYARQDSRVKVIHQKNGGAAAAKNAGLRAATGDYLCFVDSDDYLQPQVYGHMLSVLKAGNADAAHFAFRYVFQNRAEDYPLLPGAQACSGEEYLVRFLKDWTCAICVNKIYKRSLFQGVFFEEGHKIDDEYFTYRGMMNASRVVFDDTIIYNYRQRGSSAMLSPVTRKQIALDRIDCINKRRRVVGQAMPQLKRTFDVAFLEALLYLPENSDNYPETVAALKAALKGYLREPGRTFPPRYLWRGLLSLGLTSREKLLKKYGGQREYPDADTYYP